MEGLVQFPRSEIQIEAITYVLIKTYGKRLREIQEAAQNPFWKKWIGPLIKNYGKNNIRLALIFDEEKSFLLGLGIYMIRAHGHIPWILVHEDTRSRKIGTALLKTMLTDMQGKVSKVHFSPQAHDDTMEIRWKAFLGRIIKAYGLEPINEDYAGDE